MNKEQFEQRKRDHIQHSLDDSNQAHGKSGLEQFQLIHEALPELDFNEIDISTKFLGQNLKTPFYISGMTAGHEKAPAINQVLASACEARGWIFGVGSQRRDLSTKPSEMVDSWKEFRKKFPNLILIGNLGMSQVIHSSIKEIEKIIHTMGADALAIHTNPLQEVIQPEGTPQFRGNFKTLKKLTERLSCPVILKETGCGFSSQTLRRISKLKLAAIDVSGLGGTHWGRIEGARAMPTSLHSIASRTFENWGNPTTQSVISGNKILPASVQLWASGGVRNGLDAAKLIALGAHRVGYAKPALEAALQGGEDSVLAWMQQQEYELKIALFCTGYANLKLFRKHKPIIPV